MKDNNTDYQNDNSCNNSNISLSMAVISVIATLLPIIIGLALWNKLPDELPVHWGIKGNVDRLATKAEGIFIMPCLCAIIQIGVLMLPVFFRLVLSMAEFRLCVLLSAGVQVCVPC